MTPGVGCSCTRASLAPLIRALPLLVFVSGAASSFSCKSQPALPPPEATVPAPDSLFAEATLRDPDSFWARLRSGGGGALMSLPDTAAGVVFAKAHLDPRFANLVTGGLPFHVALGEAEGGGLAFAVAMKLRNLGAARATVGAWDAGAHRTVGGMDLVTPLAGMGAPSTVTALSPAGYLVLASSESDLATLGPYLTTTVAAKPAAKSSLEIRAAGGALAQARVKATNLGAWATSNLLSLTRMIAPPVFDAQTFVACVNPLLVAQASMLGDLDDVTIDIDTGDGELHAVAALTPKPGDNAARTRLRAMHPGDAAPLLETAGTATYAAFVSDTAAQRMDDVGAIAPCFEHALGGLLGREGAESLDRVLGGWAKGRGDWDTAAVVTTPSSSGIVVRASVADADASARSLHDLGELIGKPPVSDAVQQIFGLLPASAKQVDLPPFGQVASVTFARALAPAGVKARKPISPPVGLAWSASATEIDLGVGSSPTELLSSLRQKPLLGDDAATARAVRALGSDATFAAVLKPFGCCMTGGATATPLTFGWGRRGEQGWSRMELGYGLLAQVVGGH